MRETARPRGTDGARVVKVIETTALRGRGTDEDPARIVTQYWDFDGNLLGEKDFQEVKECEYEQGKRRVQRNADVFG